MHAKQRTHGDALAGAGFSEQSNDLAGQRVWKRQPLGGSIGFGGSPVSGGSIVRSEGSIDGIEASSAANRGGRVFSKIACRLPISATLPRYITITRSLMKRTTLRSWEMNM
jgi:hypothetical protein